MSIFLLLWTFFLSLLFLLSYIVIINAIRLKMKGIARRNFPFSFDSSRVFQELKVKMNFVSVIFLSLRVACTLRRRTRRASVNLKLKKEEVFVGQQWASLFVVNKSSCEGSAASRRLYRLAAVRDAKRRISKTFWYVESVCEEARLYVRASYRFNYMTTELWAVSFLLSFWLDWSSLRMCCNFFHSPVL